MLHEMSGDWIKFHFYKGPSFIGSERAFKEADYVAFGVPFDATASYRPGSRFAPFELRLMSEYLELPGEDSIRLADLGDLPLTNSVEAMLRRVGEVVERIFSEGKVPIALGGEHTLTLASASKLKSDTALVIFDAHLDLRDEYMDTRVNHTTWLRRLLENKDIEKVIVIGARAYISEEAECAEKFDVRVVTSSDILQNFEKTVMEVRRFVSDVDGVYLSFDLDVLDPGYAPGVSNPEPGGITPMHFFELTKVISRIGVKGVDVVEVNPLFDNGQAAANAVYAVYYALLASPTTSSST